MAGRGWATVAVAGVCWLAALVVSWSAAGHQVDAWAYDFLLRRHPPATRIPAAVVVALDEETLRSYGSMTRLRPILLRVLEVISGAGAGVVAVDVQLADREDGEQDRRLSQVLEATPRLVLATTLVEDRRAGTVSWEEPLPEFRARAALGHVHADPDLDGVSRQVLLEKAGSGQRRWALALEAFRLSGGAPHILETEDSLEVGRRSIPVTRREQRALRVRYLPKGEMEWISAKELMERPDVASRLRGRAVFIGVTVQGVPDRLMTPYSYGLAMPGVEIHAHLYETLARGEFLRAVSELSTLALTWAVAAALALSFHLLAGARAFLLGLVVVMAAHAAPYLCFRQNLVMGLSSPVATAWFVFLGLGTRHYLYTRKHLGLAEQQSARYQRAIHYITHEMRTPLTAIQGSGELMSRYALNEEKRKQIAGVIQSESRRLARMIEVFLSVERLSAGALELKREPVSGAEVLSACLERARPQADRKQIRLALREPAEEAILGDREFLEYACYNLISNAIKYSPANTEIIVTAERSGHDVRISVEDQGYGMDAQEIKRIFQKFYRTPKAEQCGEAGMGIGLALVEEIVVQHGGSIEVESRPQQGSRFTLLLPRAGEKVAQTAP